MPLSRSIRPEQMTNRSLILYEPAGTIRSLIDVWFSRAGVEAKVAMEVGSVETTKQLILAGLGCSILPAMAMAEKG